MALRRVTGIHSCREAIQTAKPQDLKRLWLKPEWPKSPALKELARQAKARGAKLEILPLKKLDQITPAHQGLCLELESRKVRFSAESLDPQSAILLLDKVQDPKNLGAVARTAWLMGAQAIFIPERNSAKSSPFTAKSACGGLEHIPLEVCHLKNLIKKMRPKGFWFYALSADSPHSLWNESLAPRSGFVLGGEQKGISPSLKKLCDKSLCVPQKTLSASYNVSVAGGIALAEYFRQMSMQNK